MSQLSQRGLARMIHKRLGGTTSVLPSFPPIVPSPLPSSLARSSPPQGSLPASTGAIALRRTLWATVHFRDSLDCQGRRKRSVGRKASSQSRIFPRHRLRHSAFKDPPSTHNPPFPSPCTPDHSIVSAWPPNLMRHRRRYIHIGLPKHSTPT